MSPHDYDDDYDDYDGTDEELSPEDQVAMFEGTAAVKVALGTGASKVTVAQIQEALWNYYYDVDKSVTYLKNKFVSPPPKAEKARPAQAQGKQLSFTI